MNLEFEVRVATPAARAWELVGEHFGAISEWAAPIAASSLDAELGVGAVRTCSLEAFGPVPAGEIQQRLVAFTPSAMSLTYEAIAGMPSFIGRATNTWSVVADGSGACRIRTQAHLELRGLARLFSFLLKWQFAAGGARVLSELKHRLEHDRPHARKLAAMAAHARKNRRLSLLGK